VSKDARKIYNLRQVKAWWVALKIAEHVLIPKTPKPLQMS